MTQQVKNSVRNYVEDFDKVYAFTKLTQEQKKERTLIIKGIITLCNSFKESNIWHKFKTIYPMYPTGKEMLLPKSKSISINFK